MTDPDVEIRDLLKARVFASALEKREGQVATPAILMDQPQKKQRRGVTRILAQPRFEGLLGLARLPARSPNLNA